VIDPRDALALSVWAEAPRRRLASLLQALAAGAPATPLTGPPPLEELIAWMDGSLDVSALARSLRADADRALARADRGGIRPIAWGSNEYPPLLAAIPDPPVVLWLRGDSGALSMTAIAIVGSRAASHYGLEAATEIAHDLAAAGVVVVSGMARGVDGAAHRGALAAGGRTVAVLGCGTDIAYPPEHADLADDIAGHGALVSEYPPGTIPQAFFFPVRNRIISGLARGVLVVEATDRSGSLITAAAALEQGREVMAVPGSVLSDRHRGAHALIRDGATLITGVEDVLASLGRLPLGGDPRASAEGPTGDPVLDALPIGESCPLDAIAARTGLQPAVLLARLLGLEVAGVVRRAEGGLFVRPGRSC